MNNTNRLLENLQRQVEIGGTKSDECVYLNNVSFRIQATNGKFGPYGSYKAKAVSDFEWFLYCEDHRADMPHPEADLSWWLDELPFEIPYGAAWDLEKLVQQIQTPELIRRAVLINPPGAAVISYQFQPHGWLLDMVVTMRTSDVINCLPQDILMADLLLSEVAARSGLSARYVNFHIADAHVFLNDLQYQEEHDIDLPL